MSATLSRAVLATVLSLVLTAPAAGSLSAQELPGTAVSATTGEPIPYVRITLETADGRVAAQTVSHDDGRFLLRSVPLGRYTLVASRIGYQESRVADVVFPPPSDSKPLRIALDPNPIELQGLEVEVIRDEIWKRDVDLSGPVFRRNLGSTRLYDRARLASFGERELGSILKPLAQLEWYPGPNGRRLGMLGGRPITWCINGRMLRGVFPEDPIPVEIESLMPDEVAAVEVWTGRGRVECSIWIWKTDYVRDRESRVGGG